MSTLESTFCDKSIKRVLKCSILSQMTQNLEFINLKHGRAYLHTTRLGGLKGPETPGGEFKKQGIMCVIRCSLFMKKECSVILYRIFFRNGFCLKVSPLHDVIKSVSKLENRCICTYNSRPISKKRFFSRVPGSQIIHTRRLIISSLHASKRCKTIQNVPK